jgi:hypothetical protein
MEESAIFRIRGGLNDGWYHREQSSLCRDNIPSWFSTNLIAFGRSSARQSLLHNLLQPSPSDQL